MIERIVPPRPYFQELWARVFVYLAASLEPPGGLRGPGVVAADLVRAGLACRDTLRACRAGLRALGEAVPVRVGAPPLMPAGREAAATEGREATGLAVAGGEEPDWGIVDRGLRAAGDCTTAHAEAELRAALRQLRRPLDGGRAALASRLRGALGLSPVVSAVEPRQTEDCGRRAPAAAAALAVVVEPPPARLCVALWQERDAQYGSAAPLSVRLAAALRDMVEAGDGLVGAALAQPSLAAMRRDLAALYGSVEGLLAAHRSCLPRLQELRRRCEEERRRELETVRLYGGHLAEPQHDRSQVRLPRLDHVAELYRPCACQICQICGASLG
jgi:hypothetical protein